MTALATGLVAAVLCAAAIWYVRERGLRQTRAMPAGLREDITLPHGAEYELYHNDFSLCSKKVRVCLAELGIPYEPHHVELIETGAYETLSGRFLAVNPEGTVPVLVHRGHPVYQSHDQIRYAADRAPAGAPALVPSDSAVQAEMQRWVDCASIIGDDPIETTAVSAAACAAGLTIPLFATMIVDIPTSRVLEGLVFHRLKIRPAMFLLLKMAGVGRIPVIRPIARVVRASRCHMGRHLDALEAQLARSGGPWILGAQLTLADVSWMVLFERMVEQDSLHVFWGGGRRPAAAAYWERLRARPSYREAIAAHRHPTVTRGTERLHRAKQAMPALRRLLEDEPDGSGETGQRWLTSSI